jgi:hypothetical protein
MRVAEHILGALPHGEHRSTGGLIGADWYERQRLARLHSKADLPQVWREFLSWLLCDARDGAIRFAATKEVRELIEAVSELCRSNNRGPIE